MRVLVLYGVGELHILTFPVVRIAHCLDNSTDLSLAAAHRLSDSLATAALLEHLDNPNSARLPVDEPFEGQNATLCIRAWLFRRFRVALNSCSYQSWNRKFGLSPLPDPGKAVVLEIQS
jgi:hypothetical protein